jgi:competence protein ComEC
LAIGDTVAVDPALSLAMKTSSLSHLTAVSGANCAVVIGLILLMGRALGLRRGARLGLALAVLIGFVVLVTPQPSVLRSAVMAAVALGVVAAGRPANGLSIVGVAALVLLASDPWLAVNYGFALSALATVGLLTLTSPIVQRLELLLPHWLALLVAVPLAAQLACQPILILLSPSLPPYGVLANLLAEPASPVATIVGLLACVALPVVPPVGSMLVVVAWVPSAWIAAVATFFAELPWSRLPWPGGTVGTIGLALVTVLLLAAALARMRRRTRVTLMGVGMSLSVGMLMLAVVVPGIGTPATA